MKKLILLGFLAAATTYSKCQDSTFYFTTSDSVRLYVHMAGKGQPCLFVHGGPGSTSYYFEGLPVAAKVQEQLKMIYFDQRGSGRSGSAANGDYSVRRFEKDMEELRDALDIKSWIIMGHSFAGLIITPYAFDYPSSVKALIFINCTLDLEASIRSHIYNGAALLGIKDTAAFLPDTLSPMEKMAKVHNALSDKGIWYKLMYSSQREKDINDSVSASIGNWNHDFGNAALNMQDYYKDYIGMSARIHCPVYIFAGTKDYAVGPDQYKSWKFPDTRKIALYKGGHVPFQEEPIWFAQQISGFLRNLD